LGRELKRVPIDFNWSIGKIWYGYLANYCHDNSCEDCRHFGEIKGLPLTSYNCPDFEQLNGPPKGEGYQLWETTSEGSPTSPVFATLDELCEWCEDNATTSGSFKASKEQWKSMLEAEFVYHKQGNFIFL